MHLLHLPHRLHQAGLQLQGITRNSPNNPDSPPRAVLLCFLLVHARPSPVKLPPYRTARLVPASAKGCRFLAQATEGTPNQRPQSLSSSITGPKSLKRPAYLAALQTAVWIYIDEPLLMSHICRLLHSACSPPASLHVALVVAATGQRKPWSVV